MSPRVSTNEEPFSMTRAHPWSATWPAIRLAVALLCTAGPALGLQQAGAGSVPVEAEVPPAWTPPGYYQFFHKSGALERLEAEPARRVGPCITLASSSTSHSSLGSPP